jgi:hypothetical protein
MDGEIILDRGGSVMKLDDNEQAVLDEIQLDFPKPQVMHRPGNASQIHKAPPRKHVSFQEDIDTFANPMKQNDPPPPKSEDPIDYGEYDSGEQQESYDYGGSMEDQEEQPSPGYKTVDEEKADLINKLGRLEKRGFTINKRLNAYSPVDELRTEVKRITYSIDVDKSIKFSRRMLIACVTGLEFMNKRYNPFELQLDGWSENIMENVDDYDEVFEELYVKYRTKMHVAPEVKLIMMLGGSAMMFHLTNSMFKSVMPNVNDVMKQNPGLVNNMMSAVQNTMANQASAPAPAGERHEMKGPGLDISSLMGNIMMPPGPPISTTNLTPPQPPVDIEEDDDISDIVSAKDPEEIEDGDVKEVKVGPAKTSKGRPRKKKVEINL